MSRDRIEIGPVPAEEACAQVGSDRYARVWRAECNAFRNQIRRVCGDEPDGASLVITSNPHDFGSYHDVAVSYDEGNDAALSYALKCEREAPGEWDDEARAELASKGVCTATGCEHDHRGCIEVPQPFGSVGAVLRHKVTGRL